jgi:hypothetical protein
LIVSGVNGLTTELLTPASSASTMSSFAALVVTISTGTGLMPELVQGVVMMRRIVLESSTTRRRMLVHAPNRPAAGKV